MTTLNDIIELPVIIAMRPTIDNKAHDEIERQTQEFLKRGGKIKQPGILQRDYLGPIPMTINGAPKVINKPWPRRAEYRAKIEERRKKDKTITFAFVAKAIGVNPGTFMGYLDGNKARPPEKKVKQMEERLDAFFAEKH